VSDEIPSGVLGDKETDFEWLQWRFLEENYLGNFPSFPTILSQKRTAEHNLSLFCSRSHTCVPM
jgi:hypothetical protein